MKKVVLFMAMVMLFLAGCSSSKSETSSTLEKIHQKGVLTIGTSADYAPYEFHILQDKKDEIVGFEIDMAKEIAKELGVELKIVDMNFDGLLTFLNSNQVDMVISGMTPTEERAKAVDFSDIYYTAEQVVLIRDEDLDKYKSIESFAGKKIATQKNSLQEMIFKERFSDATNVSLAKIPNIILELKNKTVDAAILEAPVAKGYVSQYDDLNIAEIEIPMEGKTGSAIAVRKGDTDLLEKVNKALDRLKQDGSIDKFVLDATLLAEQQ